MCKHEKKHGEACEQLGMNKSVNDLSDVKSNINSDENFRNDAVFHFSKAFNTSFEKMEGDSNVYSQVKVSDEKTEQMYLVMVDVENQDAKYPVKIYPIKPTSKELFGYENEADEWCCSVFSLVNDMDNSGEVFIVTPHMKRIFKSYMENGCFSEAEVNGIVQEVADWTVRTSMLRESAIARKENKTKSKRKPFSYITEECKKCKRVVLSERAYISMLAEAISRDPLETGGVLFGHYDENGTWYVVEATDPGMNTYHSVSHNEMDDKYYNHLYPVLSRLYKRDLMLVGLWHRHPNSYDRFSNDDNITNKSFADAIGNGTLSFLMNFDPKERLTCYYLDNEGMGEYHKLPVYIGDRYFKRTDYLEYNKSHHLWRDKERLNKEIWLDRKGEE